ncbi:hypothetical protein [Ralstonia solanacearum]|uniref:hypothetical protein n=1 Tax=Ralstonia solanacearum TaxID=305 RepID=UPI00068AE23C|nr:hypothetical protein [Ralstonia solanacearum]
MSQVAELARFIENLIGFGTAAEDERGTPPRIRQIFGFTDDVMPVSRTSREYHAHQIATSKGEHANAIILAGIPKNASNVPSHKPTDTTTE